MSMTNKPVEPSMEEILASIRKIIAEEPIGTRPDPAGQKPKPSPKLGPAPEALAIDDVLDMAGGAGVHTGTHGRNGAGSNGTDKSRSLGKPAASPAPGNAASASQGISAPAANGGAGSLDAAIRAASAEDLKPTIADRAESPRATIPERTAEETAVRADRPDGALSEARQKVERHLGSLPDIAERPAPLGLRSIREPRLDAGKSAAGGLLGRVAATNPLAEPVVADAQPAPADKTRAGNGAAGAMDAVPAAKAGQGEGRAEAKSPAAVETPAAATGKVETRAAEPAKAAAGNTKASLEEAVAEMLRPMLSTWLEANLPRIVQDVLREQMAKTPLPGKDKPAG